MAFRSLRRVRAGHFLEARRQQSSAIHAIKFTNEDQIERAGSSGLFGFFVCTGPVGALMQNLKLSIRDVADVPNITDRPIIILALVVTAVWQRHSSIVTDLFVMAAC